MGSTELSPSEHRGMDALLFVAGGGLWHFQDAQGDAGSGGVTWQGQGGGFGLLCFCFSSLVFPL